MLPIIVAGSRPAATVLVQRRHFDCDTSVDLHRLLHASITETPRSRVPLASTVLLNPIGSHRMPHAQQPNRHRARGTASHIPSRSLPAISSFGGFRTPALAAAFAAPSVIGRHPKTFTKAEVIYALAVFWPRLH